MHASEPTAQRPLGPRRTSGQVDTSVFLAELREEFPLWAFLTSSGVWFALQTVGGVPVTLKAYSGIDLRAQLDQRRAAGSGPDVRRYPPARRDTGGLQAASRPWPEVAGRGAPQGTRRRDGAPSPAGGVPGGGAAGPRRDRPPTPPSGATS